MHKRNSGFTLIEVLIVVIIIGILARIVIVSFQGAQNNAYAASMTTDLRNTAKQMDAARSANDGKYPTTIPSDVKPSKGNVMQMAAVSSATTDYCINIYGPNGAMMSIGANGTINNASCPGVLVGVSVGGSVPSVPRGVNLIAGLSTWVLTGDITYDSTSNELRCGGAANGNAKSPLFRVGGAASGTFTYQGMATTSTSTRPNSGAYAQTFYRAANGTTLAYNNPGNTSTNTSAPTFSGLNNWQTINFSSNLGTNVIYMYVTLNCQPLATSYYTSDTRYKNPVYKLN